MNVGLALCLAVAMTNFPEDSSKSVGDEKMEAKETVGRRTLGGKQFWTDFVVLNHWRIQRNGATGHYRLLNPQDRAIVSGKFETCKKRFDEIRSQANLPKPDAQVVVTIHGLGRSRGSMEELGKFIESRNGYTWVNFGYASTRHDIQTHAQALRSVLDCLAIAQKTNAENDEQLVVHFVGHSLGNIVVRFLLGEMKHFQKKPDWTVGRIVMLAPPNKGSAMASLLKKSRTFKLIAGKSGKNLSDDWNFIETKLATPRSEFGIIAGGRGTNRGFNPLLKGDDDLIVSVEETKLAGAADFHVFPSMHTYIMNKKDVQEATARFLAKGFFFSPEKRQPIGE